MVVVTASVSHHAWYTHVYMMRGLLSHTCRSSWPLALRTGVALSLTMNDGFEVGNILHWAGSETKKEVSVSKNSPGKQWVVSLTSSSLLPCTCMSYLSAIWIPRRSKGSASTKCVGYECVLREVLSWWWNHLTRSLPPGWYAAVQMHIDPRSCISPLQSAHSSGNQWKWQTGH